MSRRSRVFSWGWGWGCVLALLPLIGGVLRAQEPAIPPAAEELTLPNEAQLRRVFKDQEVWIDGAQKTVVLGGRVCLREGLLEMFACPRGSKEHESIVSVNCKAQSAHAALLAVGARPGRPAQFDPEYVPASGTRVEIDVVWKDAQGQLQTSRAQQWIRNIKTGQPMEQPWVFAGSGFWKDEETGKEYYYGDAGDFICVSNFPSATLDVTVKSSQDNSQLLFGAFTEHIPPLGAPVRLILKPQLPKAEAKAGASPPAK